MLFVSDLEGFRTREQLRRRTEDFALDVELVALDLEDAFGAINNESCLLHVVFDLIDRGVDVFDLIHVAECCQKQSGRGGIDKRRFKDLISVFSVKVGLLKEFKVRF